MPQSNDDVLALRRYFALTQPDLADYLGISRTLLAHIEAGRRNLPLAALARLGRLFDVLPPPYGRAPTPPAPRPPVPAEYTADGREALTWRLATCRHEAGNYAYQLRQLQRRAAPLRQRHALPGLLAALPAPVPLWPGVPPGRPVRPGWDDYLTATAELDLARFGAMPQALLEARLAGLAAETAFLEALLATLPPLPAATAPL